ncbi:MAG TPA: DUF6198 family protein [Thermoclostridium sp.]|nr:DUF6198 family protein [Thermoclostridium sp.]
MNEMDKKIVRRVITYVIGLWLLSLGVSFSVKAELGISPVNSAPYIISQITGVSMGTCVIVVFAFFMLLQMIILRKEYQWKNLLQILFSILFGYFVDITNAIINGIVVELYPVRLLLLAISIVLIAFGLMAIVDTELVPMPSEGLIIAISKKSKKLNFAQIKTIFDSVVVLTGIVLSFCVFGRLVGIREGTIITAVSVGKLIGILQEKINLKKLL